MRSFRNELSVSMGLFGCMIFASGGSAGKKRAVQPLTADLLPVVRRAVAEESRGTIVILVSRSKSFKCVNVKWRQAICLRQLLLVRREHHIKIFIINSN